MLAIFMLIALWETNL